jgi:hypothetical protein
MLWLRAALFGLLAAAVASQATAGDAEPVFVELSGAPSADAVRFFETSVFEPGQKEEPTLNLLVVFTAHATARPAGVAYFLLKQRRDCRTQTTTTLSYTAWSPDGAVVSQGGTPPQEALTWAAGPEIDARWRWVCEEAVAPRAPIPMARKADDEPIFFTGVKGAVEKAKRREADLITLSQMPEAGGYAPLSKPSSPADGVVLVDFGNLARRGDTLTLSWLFVPGPAGQLKGYIRESLAADCAKQTGGRTLTATYDESGTLVRLQGARPTVALSELGNAGKFLSQACTWPPNTRFKVVYPSFTAALNGGRAMLIRP